MNFDCKAVQWPLWFNCVELLPIDDFIEIEQQIYHETKEMVNLRNEQLETLTKIIYIYFREEFDLHIYCEAERKKEEKKTIKDK